jgi:two-component system, OmpR family, response regulator
MARVLVIDDSPTVHAALKAALSQYHQVEKLDRFVDLPQRMRESPPDVILLDLDMPALPGASFGKYVRKYQLREIPIIIHSAQTQETMNRTASDLFAFGVFSKGGPTEELLRMIDRAIKSLPMAVA